MRRSKSSKKKEKSPEIDEDYYGLGSELPNEILVAIANSNKEFSSTLSQTNHSWRKLLKPVVLESEEDLFFTWFFKQSLAGFSWPANPNIDDWKPLMLSSVSIALVIKDPKNMPRNWNFLPNLRNLTLKNYSRTTLPLLPENITELNLYDNTKRLNVSDLPSNLLTLHIETRRGMISLNIDDLPSNITSFSIVYTS